MVQTMPSTTPSSFLGDTVLSLLHEDTWQSIALCLEAPDILSLLQVSRTLNHLLEARGTLWQALLERDTCRHPSFSPKFYLSGEATAEDCRKAFLQNSYQKLLPTVHWQALGNDVRISPREAHLTCVLGTNKEEVLICTQGFTEDQTIYLKPLSTDAQGQSWRRILPSLRGQNRTAWVYGATLTPLQSDPFSAVRVGGFTSGGYSRETSQVAVLRLSKNHNDDWQASWEVKECSTQSGVSLAQFSPSRAYHAAQLVLDRYLILMGGMKSRANRSILDPVILDTQTWTWLDQVFIGAECTSLESEPKSPEGRHGCSFVWDAYRERFVLFGGASGWDILRSGRDVTDIWQLGPQKPLPESLTPDTFLQSFPWEWKRIHKDQSPNADSTDTEISATRLSPVESLCLGRCHAGHHVARDTVMLVFGSTKPSSNNVIGYDLRLDVFRRPRVTGCLPEGRLCFASAFLPRQGCIWIHSGWSTRLDGTIDESIDTNMVLLELAPYISSHPFLPQASPRPASPVTNEQVLAHRRREFNLDRGIIQRALLELLQEEHPAEQVANEWWGHLIVRQGVAHADSDEDDDIEEND